MYKNRLTVYGEHLARAQALPAAGEAEGNGGSRRAGSMLGAAEVVMVAAGAVHMAEGATLTLSLRDSADDAVFTDMPVRFRRTAGAGGLAFGAGEVMARLPLPSDARTHLKAVVATDDPGVTGVVDVLFEYLPR